MKRPLCLVIDDEPDIRELLELTLTPMNIACHTAETVAQARELLQTQHYDLCLTDMRLPDGNGIDLLEEMQSKYPNMPVIMITAYGSIETAVQALKAGAFDFIAKPIKKSEFCKLVNTALCLPEYREATNSQLPDESVTTPTPQDKMSNLVGKSAVMQALRERIEKLARSQAPIYIRGESGAGKEVVARLIHNLGARAHKPFVPVNCGAIPTELMESEFFGHKKGVFTGATADKPGLFQAAQEGTLFLDEVADLPLSMQVKLLRAIQEKQIRPVGATKEIPVDVRILSATHRDLAELVKQSKFRQDLFYRINVIEIAIPPLREHAEDIDELVDKILERLGKRDSCEPTKMSPEALSTLKKHKFPGNVRELENILERAMTLCENKVIKSEDLQLPETRIDINEDELASVQKLSANAAPLDPLLDGVEKQTILSALEKTKGNKTKAAELLGISFSALRYRLQKLKMDKSG